MRFSDYLREGLTELDASTSGFGWGVVTDNDDPKNQGRLRLRLPWHRPDQSSDWVPRLGGGGSNYGETQGIPQEGELVSLNYPSGNLHQPHWVKASWTEGGKGPNGSVPANLGPHLQGGPFANPTHKPEKGKFKIWFWRSLAGFLLHVGEGLDWLHFRTPKGFDLKLEHDVPVGGKSKGDAKNPLPWHHFKLSTPTGHVIETTEWIPNDQNDFIMTHAAGMKIEMKQKPQSGIKEIKVSLEGLELWLRVAPGVKFAQLTDGAGEILKFDALAHTVNMTAVASMTLIAPMVTVISPSVNLGGPGGAPVARLGDQVSVIDPQGGVGIGTIISGSAVVKSV